MKFTRNLLPDGRHVATLCDDELMLYAAQHQAARAELERRPKAKPRGVSTGYISFGSGQRGVPNSLSAYSMRPKRDDARRD